MTILRYTWHLSEASHVESVVHVKANDEEALRNAAEQDLHFGYVRLAPMQTRARITVTSPPRWAGKYEIEVATWRPVVAVRRAAGNKEEPRAMTDCKPPPGTLYGTRCVLRNQRRELLATWQPHGTAEPEWGITRVSRGDFFYPAAELSSNGWHYAGICPDLPDLPDVKPQTTQEIAREVLERTANSTGVIVGDDVYSAVVAALRRIAELPE